MRYLLLLLLFVSCASSKTLPFCFLVRTITDELDSTVVCKALEKVKNFTDYYITKCSDNSYGLQKIDKTNTKINCAFMDGK